MRGRVRAREDFCLAVWLANIKARPGSAEFRAFPQYAWLVQGLDDTVSHARTHGVDARALTELCSLCHALTIFAGRYGTRTVPESALGAWQLLLGTYHSGIRPESPLASQFAAALYAVQQCCSHLDMFSLQLPRFLGPVTQALDTGCTAALLASAREVLECCFTSDTAVTCTRAWPRNCVSYYALLCACLHQSRPTCGYLDFQALMATVAPLRMPPRAVSRAVAALATHVIWHRCAGPGDLNLAGIHAVVDKLPRTLHARDEGAVFIAAHRACSRRWATVPAPSCFEAWYLCAILHATLARFPFAVLRRRAAFRTAFGASICRIFALCTPASWDTDVLSRQRAVFYAVTALGYVARACAAGAYGRRRPNVFLPVENLCAVFASVHDYAVGSNYCVLLPLFQLVFSTLDHLASEARAQLLRTVSPDLVRLWFEHYQAIELSPLLFVCFLAEYAKVWPHLPVLVECCRAFVHAARPARLGPIAEVLFTCHAYHAPGTVLDILHRALAPGARPWTPRSASLVARVACTGLPATRNRPELVALAGACARAQCASPAHVADERALHTLYAAAARIASPFGSSL